MEAPLQLTAAILPYAACRPDKKWLGAIFYLAQRRSEAWPPGMAGHKKPVGMADNACAGLRGLCQTGNGDFGVRTWP